MLLFYTFAVQQKGHVAEWLGPGLQNRLQRFESARDLSKIKEL